MDTQEYKLLVAVLSFLANPYDDGAVMTIIESSLSMRARIGDAVKSLLATYQRTQRRGTPLWTIMEQIVADPSKATAQRNALGNLLKWWRRCDFLFESRCM